MPASEAWYLAGPLTAVALVGALAGAVRWRLERGGEPPEFAGLSIFGAVEDYGLLSPAAVTEDRTLAEDVRRILAGGDIRSTYAVRHDGRVVVLVFAEQVEQARRLVGGSPDRQ